MARKLIHFLTRKILEIICLGWFGVDVRGRENIPEKGAFIAAPNHKSNWDPPVVGVAVRNRLISYMAKEELFANPIMGWALRQFGTFPVKRGTVDRNALRQAVRVLRDGGVLGMFPEGTRVHGDQLGPFHSGMASIALMTGTPIVPIAVIGTGALPRKDGQAAVVIGKPIEVKKQRVNDALVEELNEKVRCEIERMIAEYKRSS